MWERCIYLHTWHSLCSHDPEEQLLPLKTYPSPSCLNDWVMECHSQVPHSSSYCQGKKKRRMGNLRKGDTLNNSRGFCWLRKCSLCMYIDLDRYFSCLQPRTDKREGVEGKGKEKKKEKVEWIKIKKGNENSRGIRELRAWWQILKLFILRLVVCRWI